MASPYVDATRNLAIKAAYDAGGITLRALGQQHGLTPERVRQIINKITRDERRAGMGGLFGIIERMPATRALRSRAHRWCEAAGVDTIEALAAIDRTPFLGDPYQYDRYRQAYVGIPGQEELYRNYGRHLHTLLDEVVAQEVGRSALPVPVRVIRKMLRKIAAEAMLSAEPPAEWSERDQEQWRASARYLAGTWALQHDEGEG